MIKSIFAIMLATTFSPVFAQTSLSHSGNPRTSNPASVANSDISSLEQSQQIENSRPSSTPFQSYVLNLSKEQLVFLDAPKTLDNNTKSFFYHIVKGNTPTMMQMLHTTANCSTKQLRIDSNTTISMDPPKVLNYEVIKKGWIELDSNGLDQAIFNYVCFNQVSSGYTLQSQTGQVAVMYYNYLQQQKK